MIDLKLYYKEGKDYHPVRICAIGKNEKDIEKSHRHIKKSNSKKNRGKITGLQKIYSKYVIVATSLPENISTEKYWSCIV